MPDFKFNCPHCNQSLEAPEEMLGQMIECPSCKGKIVLPKSEPEPPHRPQQTPPQHTGERTYPKQTVETNVKQGALTGGLVCFVIGVVMMCFSLWTVIVYAPLFLAAFVLSIGAMAQKRIAGGVLLLVLTVVVPPILLIAIPSFKSARSATQAAARAQAVVATTVKAEPESAPIQKTVDREPATQAAARAQAAVATTVKAEPESAPIQKTVDRELAKPELPPQAQSTPLADPVYRFSFSSLPSVPKGAAELMKVPVYQYNDVWKKLTDRKLSITFGGDKFYVGVEDDGDGFILSPGAAQELVNLMEKYREWKTKALAMGTTVQKDIGSISVEILWSNYNDEWYLGARPVTATCSFFSQNKQRHLMTMQFEKVSTALNEYIDHRLDTIYFDPAGVDALLAAFSRSNIDEKVAAHKRKKQMESQFQ